MECWLSDQFPRQSTIAARVWGKMSCLMAIGMGQSVSLTAHGKDDSKWDGGAVQLTPNLLWQVRLLSGDVKQEAERR